MKRSVALVLSMVLAVVFVAGAALEHWRTSQARIAPILNREQRRSLKTYNTACRRSEDCEPPLVCTIGRPAWGCYDSECQTDLDCPLGLSCQTIPGIGAAVRVCAIYGDRQAGETCEAFPYTRMQACARGLLCNQVCGSPCEPSHPESCPEGSVCHAGLNGHSCVPSCRAGGCPAGTECIQLKGDISTCARVVGQNCQKTPCPVGQDCQTLFDSRLDAVGVRCMTPCVDAAACATDSACVYGHCRKRCRLEDAGGCGPDEACTVFPDVAVACEVAPHGHP